jgi:hypothetical protein
LDPTPADEIWDIKYNEAVKAEASNRRVKKTLGFLNSKNNRITARDMAAYILS